MTTGQWLPSRGPISAVLVVLALGGWWISRDPTPPRSSPAAAPPRAAAAAAPRLLLELAGSPYRAALLVQHERAALLTSDAIYRFADEGFTRNRLSAETGDSGEVGALAGDSVLRWSDGALLRFPEGGGAPHSRLPWPRSPERWATSGEHVAWLQPAADERHGIWTLVGGEPRRIVDAGRIATMTLRDDRLFFVEELADATWRLGTASRLGGDALYGQVKRGRTPALLAVTSDLFYYDGPTFSVYRVSTDLKREERLAQDIICSPLAAADGVFCAQPGRILRLPLSGGAPSVVVSSIPGMVTALVATRSELVWLRESGKSGMAVEKLPL